MKNVLKTTEYKSGQLNPFTLLNDKTKLVKLLAFDEGFHLKPHKADADVLILILEGKARAIVFGKANNLSEMEFIIFPKGEIHEVEAITQMKMLLIK